MKEREIALHCLADITDGGQFANRVLEQQLKNRDERTQGFVRHVVYGVLDRKEELDQAIDRANRSGRKRLDPVIRNILRLSLYQLWYMDKTAPHGVVNDAVHLAKKRMPRYAGFVNGLLRTLQKDSAHKTPSASVPEWLEEKLTAVYGKEKTEALLFSIAQPPRLSIRINPLRTTRQQLQEDFLQHGMVLRPSAWPGGLFIVEKPRDIFSSPMYKDGHFTAQDEAAAQVVLHAGAKTGESWLDVCAAPGGKSTQLAETMQDRGTIVACDLYAQKTEKIQTHAARLQLQSIKTRVQDATVRVEEWEKAFHGVLVDAPCSGLGLLRRKPDIKVHRKPEDIKELLVLQKDILRQAAQYVRPGGKLVYSTCTLLPDENEEQVRRFLAQHPDYVPDGKDFERRIDMTESGADGFYMARLRRK
ncbi:MAG: 16S rRNA (cytosine(967)-C(5))-methyltransferase RsmB [Peptoniphilaceae bacterium]|jgi:16S rRNA (cytosine967-C5)-methyltransferase